MKLCDYGCGREAKYPFKNGKWCCENNTSKCPKVKRKNKESHEGKTHSEETIEKMRQAHEGKTHTEETKKKIGQGRKGKTYTIEKIQEKHPILGRLGATVKDVLSIDEKDGRSISGKGLRDKSLEIFNHFVRIQENAINSIECDDVSIISRATLYCIALEIIEEKKEVRK